jgi:imidazolonepropionase-like amidohydrolase
MLRVIGFAAMLFWASAEARPAARYDDGLWFDGEKFRRRTAFIEDGRLRFAESRRQARDGAAEIVDLDGAHVIPPLCEAHNHNLGSDYQNAEHIAAYLQDGVFYVKILSDLPREYGVVRHTYNRPDSVDAAFAHGGVTGPGGHPIRLREQLLAQGVYDGFTKETLADHAYFVIDSDADIVEKWPLILQYGPDFLKLLLVYSEHYAERRDDPEHFGGKGLSPEIYRRLVDLAHRHGLHVSTHVNSAYDFHVAVDAGSDEIAHLPGAREPQSIDRADAKRAAEKGIVVVTTASLIERRRNDESYDAIRNAQIANLRLLKEEGVILAVGSDEYSDTSVKEVAHLRGLGVFSNGEMLRMWTENCALTIFPKRRIGKLQTGAEASFLVLDGDPLEDLAAAQRIQRRVKDGRPLDPAPADADN